MSIESLPSTAIHFLALAMDRHRHRHGRHNTASDMCSYILTTETCANNLFPSSVLINGSSNTRCRQIRHSTSLSLSSSPSVDACCDPHTWRCTYFDSSPRPAPDPYCLSFPASSALCARPRPRLASRRLAPCALHVNKFKEIHKFKAIISKCSDD